MKTSVLPPVLYVFAISHYCEKARWALDYLNIDYRLQHLSPISYMKFVRSLGVADTTLPVLTVGSLTIQGSSKIIDWAETHCQSSSKSGQKSAQESEIRTLAADSDANVSRSREIERRLDDLAGVHIRRYYYSEALLDQPQQIRRIFSRHLPWHQQLMLRLAWNKICQHMIRGLDLGPEQSRESRQIIETELDWLDELLAGNRRFLLGERFSRADIAAASLLSPLVSPPQHPTYHNLQLPPGVAADAADWQERPSMRWIRDIYRDYRKLPKSGSS
jgi:glutathione S-transferase